MNLDKQAKRKQIKHCQQALQDCHHLLVIKYAGLSVQELETLRDLITENGGYLKIFKNRLMQQALKSSKYSDLQKYLTGQNAFI